MSLFKTYNEQDDDWRYSNAYCRIERIFGYIIFSLFTIYFIFSLVTIFVKERVKLTEVNYSKYIEIEITPKENLKFDEYVVCIYAKEYIENLNLQLEIDFNAFDGEKIIRDVELNGNIKKNKYLRENIHLRSMATTCTYEIKNIEGEALV